MTNIITLNGKEKELIQVTFDTVLCLYIFHLKKKKELEANLEFFKIGLFS